MSKNWRSLGNKCNVSYLILNFKILNTPQENHFNYEGQHQQQIINDSIIKRLEENNNNETGQQSSLKSCSNCVANYTTTANRSSIGGGEISIDES